jgi:colicin import membrane protein
MKHPQAARTAFRFAHPLAGGTSCGLAEPAPRMFSHGLFRGFLAALAFSGMTAALAQPAPPTPPTPSSAPAAIGDGYPQDLQPAHDRIAARREVIDDQLAKDEAACYQRFFVNACLRQARDRHRDVADDLNRQEAVLNDVERKRQGAEELRKLDDQVANPRSVDLPESQQQARQAQKDREQRAAEHASDRANAAAQVEQNRQSFQNKLQNHADDQARAARQAAEAPAQRQSFQRKLDQAAQHRADRVRENAQQTKPPAAPLPDPPQ